MYEHRRAPLAPQRVFLLRLAANTAIALAIIAGSLAVGAAGYHGFEDLPWIDATLNAAMILGGMGPVDPLHTDAGKVFASCYAIYCGVALLTIVAVLLAPVYHRFIHRFHLVSGSGRD
jgi:hypothetical protein